MTGSMSPDASESMGFVGMMPSSVSTTETSSAWPSFSEALVSTRMELMSTPTPGLMRFATVSATATAMAVVHT